VACADGLFQGDVFQLFIPSELAYGDTPRGAHIKAGDVLIFDLELIKINGASKDTSKDEL
jgi:FKBP-type peptidyl-prolyl cis-trans isomerase FklB